LGKNPVSGDTDSPAHAKALDLGRARFHLLLRVDSIGLSRSMTEKVFIILHFNSKKHIINNFV
jgi:hypothetical protein